MGLSPRQRRIALAFAEAILPPGKTMPGANDRTIDRLEVILARFGANTVTAYGALLSALDLVPLPTARRPFSRLGREQRESILQSWLRGDKAQRTAITALSVALKTAHFDDPQTYSKLGCVYNEAPKAEAKPRWWQQVQPADTFEESSIECDVVVVGTGAGGAVAAARLAKAGYAVIMLEEGSYATREHFNGRSSEMMGDLYRNAGATYSVGNTVIPIPLGRTVGGTTTVNSGTCFRTPDVVLERWRREHGLDGMTPEALAPYFDEIETELGIERAPTEYLGGAARVVARGADALGWSHHALKRNAPGCDGQGVCVFGCPTDAKRSTNVSYVPKALSASAYLLTGASAERVLTEGGRACGVEAVAVANGRRFQVRSRAVVLACGALMTPALLLRQGLLRGNRNVGRNLTIHPAIGVSAEFTDESIRGWEAIPQGYCVDEFHADGILMEGSSLPLEGGATSFHMVGRQLVEAMEAYDRIASFGAMIAERASSGRVVIGRGGKPTTLYWLKDHDVARLQRAMVLIGKIFFAAGASRLMMPVHRFPEIGSESALERLGTTKLRADELMITAYHPLATCRMGADPSRSVVGPDNQAHDLPGLYITDGSAVPTSPTVNPQVTIMGLAAKAADGIAEALDSDTASVAA